jgi:AcrR family transcriptional regulator
MDASSLPASDAPSGKPPADGPPSGGLTGRPLRKDAERNRQRILRAAADVFTARGLEATLDDVAHHAGVGVGTVYRRFPGKEALADALFHERLDGLVAMAEESLAQPDAWAGLVSFLEKAGTVVATDRGMRQMLMFATYGQDRVGHARARMLPVVTQLVHRAQEQGTLRADLSPTDIPVIEFMLGTAAEYAEHSRPAIWRRYLTLILDGLRADRSATTPLPEPALHPDEVEQAMRRGAPAPPAT